MNKRSLIRYKHDNEKGLMHYVVFEGDVVVLSQCKSKKVAYIEENGRLDITFDIEKTAFDNVKAEVIKDPEYVKRVYDYMIETNNAYFKDEEETLCAIVIR